MLPETVRSSKHILQDKKNVVIKEGEVEKGLEDKIKDSLEKKK